MAGRLLWRRNAGHDVPAPPPEVLTYTGTPPPIVVVGQDYLFQPVAAGGTPPYTHDKTAGTLPEDITQNAGTGEVSGESTEEITQTGIVLRVRDSGNPVQSATIGPFEIAAITPAPPADLTVAISTTDDQFVDITAWLDTIFDNNITATVAGDFGMKAWGYESLQTNGQTRSWVDRKLREMLWVVTRGAAVGNGTITFSALDGPNESGSLSTYIVTVAIQANPVATTRVGGRWSKAGNKGFPLKRLGSATDWELVTQSDLVNAPLALWDGTTADAARIAWASDGATPTTNYLGTKKVPIPTTGDAAYTATVKSVSLGITNRVLTFNVDGDLMDIIANPALERDSSSMNQLIDAVRNGRSDGTVPWGAMRIMCGEGVFNATAASQEWAPKQPTGAPPASPYGSNASPSWDYADGWNTQFIEIFGELPPVYVDDESAPICQAQIQSGRIQVDSLTNQLLGYRFWNMDLCKGDSASPISLFIRDNGQNVRGTHMWAIDHCTRANINTDAGGDGDYCDAIFICYNDFDNDAPDFSGSALKVVGTDCQQIGNIWRHWDGDMMNGFTYCSVVGNGKNKCSWNVSVDKRLSLGAHSDFSQCHAFSAKKYINKTLYPPGTQIDLGQIAGNWSTKGKGKILDEDDVGYIGLYFQAETVSGPGFEIGDTVSNGSGRTGEVVGNIIINGAISARAFFVQLADPNSPFTNAEFLTATSGPGAGTTGTTNCSTTVTAVVGSHVAGNILRNAGDTKRAEILSVTGSPTITSITIKMTVGAVFTNGEALTNVNTAGTLTKGAFAAAPYTTRPGGMVYEDDVGKTVGDCQGFYNNAPQDPVVSVEAYRRDINHIYEMFGNIVEGLDSYGLMRLPPPADSDDVLIVNNLVTPPWGVLKEVGETDAYYEGGRFQPGYGCIFPTGSFISGSTAGQSIPSLGSRIIGRNVFMCGVGFQNVSAILSNDLIGPDFGNPDNETTNVPSEVTLAMKRPTSTALRTCIADIIEDFAPAPGGLLTTQGTDLYFGPIIDEIDYNRQTYDRAALAQL